MLVFNSPYPNGPLTGPLLVGGQTYAWGVSAQTFTLDSLTGGNAATSTIEEGDIIVCALATDTASLQTPFAINPGFFAASVEGNSNTYLHIYIMVAPAAGTVTGQFKAMPTGRAASAVFHVLRNTRAGYQGYTSGDNIDPGSLTPASFPSYYYAAAAGRPAGAASFTAFGGMDGGRTASYAGSIVANVIGAAIKRVEAGAYNPSLWAASTSLSNQKVIGILLGQSDATSLAFGRVKKLVIGGATAGSAAINQAYWAGINGGNATTSTAVQLQGANSISFNGSQSVHFNDAFPPTVILNARDFTIEFTVRFNSTTDPIIFIRNWDTPSEQMFTLLKNSGKLQFHCTTTGLAADAQLVEAAWTPSTGVNYHVRVCRYGNTVLLFVDGVSIGSGMITGSIFQGNGETYIGLVKGGGAGLNGYMGEIRILDYALNTTTASFTKPTTPWPRS